MVNVDLLFLEGNGVCVVFLVKYSDDERSPVYIAKITAEGRHIPSRCHRSSSLILHSLFCI